MNRSLLSTAVSSLLFILLVLAPVGEGDLARAQQRKRVPRASRADLQVRAVVIDPASPEVNKDHAKISVIVQNVGGTTTSATCSLNLSVWSVDASGQRVNGKTSLSNLIPMYSQNVGPLDPSQETTINAFHTFRFGGRHKVYGHINTESLAPGEEKGENNQYQKVFVVKGPDLVICFKKSNVSKRYEKNYYPVTVKNVGKVTSPADCKLFFQIDDKGTEDWTLPGLDPNATTSRQRSVYWGWSGLGVHSFQIRIACPVASGEARENNKFEGHIRVRRRIDDSSDGWSNSETVCSDTFQ